MFLIPHRRAAVAGWLSLALAGCAGLPDAPDDAARTALAVLAPTTPPEALAQDDADRLRALLAQPLSADDAVELALRHSPALAAWRQRQRADAAELRQSARLGEPVFSFERLHGGGELAIARTLSIGLWELLTLPQRLQAGEQRLSAARLRAVGELVDQISAVRHAWIDAVSARQLRAQAERVADAAEAGAELARRGQAAGNFTALQRAREQAYRAEALVQRSAARHTEVARREALVRALGLTEDEAAQLRLPERLPDLPGSAPSLAALAPAAQASRLDLRLAQAELDAATQAQGLGRLASLADVELAARLDSSRAAEASSRQRGAELSLRLPLWDGGSLRREALDARSQAAWLQREATLRQASSQLREAHSAWLSAWEVARQHRDELLPLRQAIADETLLRYNGMLLGVFELLADARDQAAAVQAAIGAQAQFWHTDAALQAHLLGRPQLATVTASAVAAPSADAGH